LYWYRVSSGFFQVPLSWISWRIARKPCIHAAPEKTYRRLPCVFSQALSTAKGLFPQVFCHLSGFFSRFSGF
jgi:hypothetical protein